MTLQECYEAAGRQFPFLTKLRGDEFLVLSQLPGDNWECVWQYGDITLRGNDEWQLADYFEPETFQFHNLSFNYLKSDGTLGIPKTCRCDFHSVIMRTGCQCGGV